MKKSGALWVGHIMTIALLVLAFPSVQSILFWQKTASETAPIIATTTDTEATPSSISPVTYNTITPTPPEPLFLYAKMINGCGAYWGGGTCTPVHSEPKADASVVTYVRNGMVLRVGDVVTDEFGARWYEIIFKEWLRYPERVAQNWYIAEHYVEEIFEAGEQKKTPTTESTKHIVVDKSEQKLYAYDNGVLVLDTIISTGTDETPTPVGSFSILRKTPSRYMQGPLPESEDVYDLPGVPWTLYFTKEGAAIHGTYWHTRFGHQTSHGCVNVPLDVAQLLYGWADVGTKVTVQL